MRKFGWILFAVGASEFLIGGAGLDGPTFASSAILTVASFLIAAVGYKLRENSLRKERKIEAAKEALQRSKEITFNMWVKSCRMDESF